MLPFIVAGLTTGSIFALAAVGLVLTYKTSGIFNFAHGALASASAFLFYFLHVQHGVAWPLAAALCVGAGGPVLGFILERVARRLAAATLTMKVLGTVGILLAIQGGLELLYPPGTSRAVPQFLPVNSSFDIAGTPVGAYRVIIFAIVLIAVFVLTVFLRWSRTGLAMRAVVDDPQLLDVTGTSPVRVRRFAWLIGASTAAASGVLLAPLLPLDATTMTFLVVTAFGAAAIGAFRNLPLTYLGGLAIGVGQALLQKYFISSTGLTGGLSASLPFLVLFVLLLVAPRLRRPSPATFLQRTRASSWRPPWTVQLFGIVCLLAVLAAVPQFGELHIADWTSFLAYTILFLSLGLLVRMSGQVSLAHISFMAIGVAAFSHLAADHHWPWLAAVIVAGLIAAPIGALLAIPAIRFPGLYLALATLGFGILLQQMFYSQSYMFGALGLGIPFPRPHLSWLDLDSDKGYYYLVLAITVVVAVLVVMINRSRLGRLLRAMADSPAGLGACGASINVSRVLVFCLSASLAAIAGVLDGGSLGIVGGSSYQPLVSLQLFALIMLTVGQAPWYAVAAAAAQILAPAYISASVTVSYALTALFGVGAILFSVSPASSRELPPPVRRAIDRLVPSRGLRRWGRPIRSAAPADAASDSRSSDAAATASFAGPGLRVAELSVWYGGVLAADEVSLVAEAGKITGLIGPNGAGKTTVFNACSGLIRPSSGTMQLDQRSLGRLGPPARARRGLGRTFQQMELFDSLSARENVALGCEGGYAGWNPVNHLFTRRSQRDEVRQRTAWAIELCAISGFADEPVGALSTGQRRLVELARCAAGRFHVLLLDEPSSGLDRVETERFGEILTRVVAERRAGILLIEHDMALVNRICDYIYVIDFGKPIFQGTAGEVGASVAVRAAYLGDEDSAAMRAAEADVVQE
jgi:ABC-type branched-subunit amino acid transport system ATPase component/branched-subunit amino acid ABC-type transport system permease component